MFVNTLGAIIRNLRNLGDGLPFGIGATIPLTLWGGGTFLAVWVLLCQKSGNQGLILFHYHDPEV